MWCLATLAFVLDSGSEVSRPLPEDVYAALRHPRFLSSQPSPAHVVSADFDGDATEDWAVLATDGRGTWRIALAYHRLGEWRVGGADEWQTPLIPVAIRLLRPGSYQRAVSASGPLQPNERQSIDSPLTGIFVTFKDGRQRAYQLGTHSWAFVEMGKGH